MSILQVQQRTASGLTNVGQFPQSIVGSMGSAIIESGSNANGNYVKFADGTQLCFASIVTTDTQRELSFPAAFTTLPILAFTDGTNFGDQTGYNTLVYLITHSKTGFSCKVEYQNQLYTGIVGISYIATGKWK